MSNTLPPASATALAASQALTTHIREDICRNQGWIPFSRFMEMALYTPLYGYYTGGAHKIGPAGDFITAPTLSPLFGQAIAKQLQALLPQTDGNIYEFGAGTGALAATLLQNLSDGLKNYYIIEVSPELADRQRQYITETVPPEAAAKVYHLSTLPEQFNGIIIGNEVLDAIPCEVVRHDPDGFKQMGVSCENDHFEWHPRPLPEFLRAAAANYFPEQIYPYTSELHPAQYAFTHTIGQKLKRGAVIFIDYGFDAAQYYHPQRQQGTLIGHYRHHTIHDPFFHIGLTDLTAHVNFTDIAQAGTDAGMDLIGYTTQANFLLNLNITGLLENTDPSSADYIRHAATLHKLIGQHEMGELFKVIAFGRDIDPDWQGFSHGDICHKL
ncbi:S-adenosyl-L-methionine-dependent methyltransferase family protein [Neisseria arctica]|uniref:S-adenosyl-L-methionine-dependent methyltransferase family protein n=1 Tax=Neisseria arctica TaxID=1470200 RepID=A0A0J0YS70_9NEIS|nr:class I SAM-dependent methyltransferase [Neisseria arctica]KLT72976.1 S-adenosyl-L-methionine-dependent methyltransferase family protein [Neisseria arctica]UOO86478.1 class I SAM-dependent methyltransferase [Neisseria arctica]